MIYINLCEQDIQKFCSKKNKYTGCRATCRQDENCLWLFWHTRILMREHGMKEGEAIKYSLKKDKLNEKI